MLPNYNDIIAIIHKRGMTPEKWAEDMKRKYAKKEK